jgi:DNA-directed RNA polymerase specialized sigma24 family protein
LFREDTNSLYLLSFLLTANQEKAERCFVTGLDDCVDGNPVFHHWAHAWARRVIVRNAIRVVVPRPGLKTPIMDASHNLAQTEPLRMSAHDGGFAGVLALEDFERFVYVLSVLEKYSDKDSALLLHVSIQEVRETRARAVQHIAGFDK